MSYKAIISLVFFVLCSTVSFAQNKTLPNDSLLKLKAKEKQEALDSQLSNKKKEIGNAVIDKKNNLFKDSSKYKQQFHSQKNNAISKVDSQARKQAVNNFKNQASSQLNTEKSKLKTLAQKANMPWNKKGNLFGFSGEIRSENYATTAQNPLMRNEMVYSRLYLSPTISLLGLPFKSNFFLTTENNNSYKSDFFSLRLDVNAMRQKAATEMQKQIDEAKKLDRLRQFDLQKNALETQRYENELNALKNQIPDVEQLQKSIEEQAKAKSKDYIEEQKKLAEEKLRNASEEEKIKIEQELKHKQDSIILHYQKQANDSVIQAKGKIQGKADTAQLARYLRMQEKLQALKQKKEQLNELRQLDSAKLLNKASGMRNPDDLRKLAKEQMPGNGFLQQILAVDRFGIGIVNPVYSEFTLFASSIKGIDLGVNQNKYFYDITAGKTTKQFTGPFANTKPIYDRNIAVVRAGIGQLKGNHLSAEYLYAYDQHSNNKTVPMVKNGVLNVSAQATLLKKIELNGNAAQSDYKESYIDQKVQSSNNTYEFKPSAFMAYQLKATQSVSDNIKIEAQVKQTGAAFRTVGNPFLRRNFREMEYKYDQQLFKKKVKVAAFYKEMRDNLVELNKATNRMKGYGLKLSTNFEKYPNLTLSYSPYQQGNNHPDSAYRTNNQFSVTNAMLTYKKRFKTVNWNGLLSYTNSAMQLNDLGTVSYKLINTVHTFQIGNRNTSIISYLNNITAPFVDSLNSNSIQFSHNYLAKKGLVIGVIGEQTQYKNGAFKSGGGMQMTATLFKNFNLSLITRYDRINKLWRLDNANVFTGKLILVWRW